MKNSNEGCNKRKPEILYGTFMEENDQFIEWFIINELKIAVNFRTISHIQFKLSQEIKG